MSWKDISKSSYTIESVKFTLVRPSHPFTIPYQGPKVRYSEGDEVSSVSDYRFNLDFTGIPLDDSHFPCGYWHKNYIPPFTIIYTSCLYPLEDVESAGTYEIDLIDGIFKSVINHYTYVEDISTVNIVLSSGEFKSPILTYIYEEGISTSNVDLISGVFKDAIHAYNIPGEYVNTTSLDLISGIFKDAIIQYEYWPYESLETSSINLISGVHNDP